MIMARNSFRITNLKSEEGVLTFLIIIILAANPSFSSDSVNNEVVKLEYDPYVDLTMDVIEKEGRDCSLSLAGQFLQNHRVVYEVSNQASELILPLQIFYEITETSLAEIFSTPKTNCDIFFFFIADNVTLGVLGSYFKEANTTYNYEGKYVFVNTMGSAYNEWNNLIHTYKLKKTTDLLVAWPTKSNKRVLEMWTHWIYSHTQFRKIGYTNAKTNAATKHFIYFPRKYYNLHQYPIVVKTFTHSPSSFMIEDDDGVYEGKAGLDVMVVTMVSQALNASIAWKHPGPGLWGTQYPNGSWDGIVGQIGYDDGDMAVANVFLREERARVIQFTFPYDMISACFITPSPQILPRWQSISHPFAMSVWIGLALAVPVSAFAMFGVGSVNKDKTSMSLSKSFLYVFGVFSLKGQDDQTRFPLRILSMALVWMGFILAVSYSGNLTANLTVVSLEPPIKTIQQLDESGYPIYGFGTFFQETFRLSTNPYLRNLVPRFIPIQDTYANFINVANRKGALIENVLHLKYVQRRFYTTKMGVSPLRIQEECYKTYSVGAILNKHSPLKKPVDQAILRISSAGLKIKFKEDSLNIEFKSKKYDDGKPSWRDLNQNNTFAVGQQVLTLEHMSGGFIVFGLGVICAVLVFLCELASLKCKKSSTPTESIETD